MEKSYQSVNKALWEARTPYHIKSEFYDVPGFLAGEDSLKSIEKSLLGDLKGQEVLHLQCHFGQDSLSMARMGAKVTGVDFSEKAINTARSLNLQLGLDAKFICSDVLDLKRHLDQEYDLVFTSYGVIGWLPDLRPWGQLIADSLKPGGRFVMAEFHPVVWMFGESLEQVQYSYFNRGPIEEIEEHTYADQQAPLSMASCTWNHSLSKVIEVLLEAGLQLSVIREYDYSPYDIFGEGVPVDGGYQVKGKEGLFPLVYALEAIKNV